MQQKDVPKEQVISVLKEWASPILIGIVGMLLWRDVTEMRNDVKLLLTQQSADRVKIEQLESDVNMLKSYLFTNKQLPEAPAKPTDIDFFPVAFIHKQDDEMVPAKRTYK